MFREERHSMHMERRKMHRERCRDRKPNNLASKLLGGIFVIGFGVLVLLNQMGQNIPHSFVSWEMILILVGIVSLVKHKFKKLFGLVPIAVGAVFMINDFYPDTIEKRFIWPVLIIIFGISILIKALRPRKVESKHSMFDGATEELSADDFVDATAFFGAVKKNIVSKNFRGAKMSSVFGGIELNLEHADLQGPATIEVNCVFGGISIIVPSNWKVETEVSSAFGGFDDNRQLNLVDETSGKILIIKGSCYFGGIEVTSHA